MERLAGGILRRDNKILLGKRHENRASYPGVWDVIGGHCHENESFTDGLCRELSEEIGIIPTHYELLIRVDNSPTFVLEIYLIQAWRGEVSNRCPDEHAELSWFTVGEASNLPLADERYKAIFALAFADKI